MPSLFGVAQVLPRMLFARGDKAHAQKQFHQLGSKFLTFYLKSPTVRSIFQKEVKMKPFFKEQLWLLLQ